MIRRLWLGPRWLMIFLVVAIVWTYRALLRPFLPPSCRFQPGCSEYMVLSVRKYGPIRGAWRGLKRVCRCNPWSAGGDDPP
jgi:uncharacterized protein